MVSRKLGRGFCLYMITDDHIRENMEYIRKLAVDREKIDCPLYFCEKSELLDSMYTLLCNIEDRAVTQDLRRFFKLIYDENCEIDFSHVEAIDGKNRRVIGVALPALESIDDASVYLHEYVHYLNEEKRHKMYYSSIIEEMLSIFIQFLYGNFCDEIIVGAGDVSFEKMAFESRVDSDLDFTTPISDHTKDIENPAVIDTIRRFKYFISNVYAQRLFEIYKDDPQNVQKKLKAIFRGGLSVDEVNNYYGIDMKDDKTIEATAVKLRKRTK